MPDDPRKGWVWRGVTAWLPRDFRERHAAEMRWTLEEHLRGRSRWGRARAWMRFGMDTMWRGCALRVARWRRRARNGRTTMDGLGQDLAFAARALRRRPGFSVVAVLTLGVGIGANTALFSVVNGVLLRPLPYRAADRIGILWHELGDGAQNLPALHPLDLYDYRARSALFEDFTLASGREWILGGADAPELVDVGLVEAGFFEFLGVEPLHGRTFTPEQDLPGAARTVLLSHRVWGRRFGGDPGVVGGTVDLAGTPMTVVGVLPESFRLALPAEAFLLRDADVWTPVQVDPEALPPRNYTGFTGFGRLRPGATFEAAQEELDVLVAQLREEHPVHEASNLRARVVPLLDDVVKGARGTLLFLLGAVGFVLLVACANVANLVLVRGRLRASELSLRAALGAGRGGLVRLVLAESLLLAGAGALLGFVLAALALQVLPSLTTAGIPRGEDIRLDGTVLGFLVALTALSAVFFGLLPALKASRRDPAEALHADSSRAPGRGGTRGRDLLVIGEVAASLVLLVGTGLMVRSFVALGSVDPGYDTEGVLTFRVNLPASGFDDGEARQAFVDRLFDRLAGLPGVDGVAGVSQLPLTGSGPLQPYAYDEETARAWESVTADQRRATPGFFDAVGATLLEGRDFTREDAESGDRIIVDGRLAERAFPGGSAVGQRLQVNPDDAPEEIRYARIVGVVNHLRLHDLSRPHLTQIWFPMHESARFSVVIRTSGDPRALLPAVRTEVGRLAPGAPVEDVRTMAELADGSLAPIRLAITLMIVFGVVALLLASVGVYGVLSYTVSQRTREIGIRMAMGESPREARRLVLGRGLRLVAAALAAGLLGSAALSRLLSGLLFEVEPVDPLTYAGTSLVLATVALAACWVPARRATRVDPAIALRE